MFFYTYSTQLCINKLIFFVIELLISTIVYCLLYLYIFQFYLIFILFHNMVLPLSFLVFSLLCFVSLVLWMCFNFCFGLFCKPPFYFYFASASYCLVRQIVRLFLFFLSLLLRVAFSNLILVDVFSSLLLLVYQSFSESEPNHSLLRIDYCIF